MIKKIATIIEFYGYEGFETKEEAFEEIKDRVDFYKHLSDPAIMYRVVGVKNKKLIDKTDIGEHVTIHEWERGVDDNSLSAIGADDWEDGTIPYILKLSVPLKEIDIIQTIIQNLNFPNEWEITLKNKGRGAKILKVYKMKGY